MAQLIQGVDGQWRIQGIQFPNPDPDGTIFNAGSTTIQFSVLLSEIVCLQEMRWDNATGQQGEAGIGRVVLIWTKMNNYVPAIDGFDEIYTLWQQQIP